MSISPHRVFSQSRPRLSIRSAKIEVAGQTIANRQGLLSAIVPGNHPEPSGSHDGPIRFHKKIVHHRLQTRDSERSTIHERFWSSSISVSECRTR